eukprot:366506-Chlamydomonas_euryale.AAC.13
MLCRATQERSRVVVTVKWRWEAAQHACSCACYVQVCRGGGPATHADVNFTPMRSRMNILSSDRGSPSLLLTDALLSAPLHACNCASRGMCCAVTTG